MNPEKVTRKKKKGRTHDKYMAKQEGRKKATYISAQNKHEEIIFHYLKIKIFYLNAH